ncbi:mitochondrial import inner membrane translocase subunit Tim10 B isoform X3 [Phyllostomus hastatus]|uniref:mitochondrial import inner membrane translocase subunit Tim10 B isoform X3 n=1 Tax=Phyllostomus hastatus TaxID=9423 RepID=UPI001E684AAB|nr:mitochondrial import inner membrane translocase subunit Tim10 B isoform X3 [Phyllostomus hastatus]
MEQQQQEQQQLRNEACLHSCAGKLIHSNHRLMAAYVQLMPALVQRRIADYEAASAVPVGVGPSRHSAKISWTLKTGTTFLEKAEQLKG